jgi:hypothetical protein
MDWYQIYKSFESHLYSTQWLIVDFNVLEKLNKTRQRPSNGLLILVEEVPGQIKAADMTKLLTEV